MRKNLLTIAGFDPTGGAGLQVDLKTFFIHGHHGLSAATAITHQNTMGVTKVEALSGASVSGQIQTLAADIPIDGIKIGMLANKEVVQAVIQAIENIPPCIIVLDPVLVSSSGMPLLEEDAIQLLKEGLFPLCSLITPNLPEAELLTGMKGITEEGIPQVAEALLPFVPEALLIKGGHLADEGGDTAMDQLFTADSSQQFSAPRLKGKDPHGTGCVLSSAILSHLVGGDALPVAIQKAKSFTTKAIEGEVTVGRGKKLLNLWQQIS